MPGTSNEIMNIRIATNQDRDDVQRVHLCAFPQGEREIVSKLAIDLLSEKTTPQTISLVAETDGAIVGGDGSYELRVQLAVSLRWMRFY